MLLSASSSGVNLFDADDGSFSAAGLGLGPPDDLFLAVELSDDVDELRDEFNESIWLSSDTNSLVEMLGADDGAITGALANWISCLLNIFLAISIACCVVSLFCL